MSNADSCFLLSSCNIVLLTYTMASPSECIGGSPQISSSYSRSFWVSRSIYASLWGLVGGDSWGVVL